jgi:beta-glucosidase
MTPLQRAAAAINAGNDVDFPGGDSYKLIPEAIEKGLVSEQTFENAVKRVLKFKYLVGALGDNVKLYDEGNITYDTPDERNTAYQLATQSVVLLKNNGVLPLKNPSKIALTGPNANSMWAMLGDYTYQSMRFFWKGNIEDGLHPKIVGLKEGLQSRLPKDFTLDYQRGCDWTEEVETVVEQSGDPRVAYLKSIQNRMIDSGEEADMKSAVKMAANSDVIIAAVGENAILCGENRDRKTLRLPGRQEEFVEKLIATGKPVILVIFGGRAQVIAGLAEKCAAVIQAWYPGEEGGNALADIILGNVCPSGKLSVSYPAVELHEPICYNYGLDTDNRIAYPFGYGLSYTTFEYSNIVVDPNVSTNADWFHVSVDVSNTGSVSGDEIVQLYVSPTSDNQNIKPIQLQGFSRVTLAPGEKKTVKFAVAPSQLGYFNNGKWNITPGKFTIKIGASSADIRQSGVVELTGENVVLDLRKEYFSKVE